MNQALEEQSTAELIKIIKDDATKLVSQHLELAKIETAKFVTEHVDSIKSDLTNTKQDIVEKASAIAKNSAYFASGSLVFYTGFIFILIAAALVLNDIFIADSVETYGWAGPLIVGVVTSSVGFFMISKAKKAFEEEKIVPELSTQHIKENQKWISKQIPTRA